MTSERVQAADGGVGERCEATRLDEASDLRGALSNGATTVGNSRTGAALAGAGGRNDIGEATSAAAMRDLGAGGAREKRERGEASGEEEAATSRGKRPRADKNRKKSPKQRKAEKKQRTEQQ